MYRFSLHNQEAGFSKRKKLPSSLSSLVDESLRTPAERAPPARGTLGFPTRAAQIVNISHRVQESEKTCNCPFIISLDIVFPVTQPQFYFLCRLSLCHQPQEDRILNSVLSSESPRDRRPDPTHHCQNLRPQHNPWYISANHWTPAAVHVSLGQWFSILVAHDSHMGKCL